MDIDKFVLQRQSRCPPQCFGSLMDIDKFVHATFPPSYRVRFGPLMDIDKFVQTHFFHGCGDSFGSLMDKIKQDLYYTLKAAILGGLFHAFITTNCEN